MLKIQNSVVNLWPLDSIPEWSYFIQNSIRTVIKFFQDWVQQLEKNVRGVIYFRKNIGDNSFLPCFSSDYSHNWKFNFFNPSNYLTAKPKICLGIFHLPWKRHFLINLLKNREEKGTFITSTSQLQRIETLVTSHPEEKRDHL